MHWLPKLSIDWLMISGVRTVAELIETLSALPLRICRTSSKVRMPPPTVRGMKTCSDTWRTRSETMSRPSAEAVIS